MGLVTHLSRLKCINRQQAASTLAAIITLSERPHHLMANKHCSTATTTKCGIRSLTGLRATLALYGGRLAVFKDRLRIATATRDPEGSADVCNTIPRFKDRTSSGRCGLELRSALGQPSSDREAFSGRVRLLRRTGSATRCNGSVP